MVVSPYRTKLTRMIQNGESSPERDTEKNHKSSKSSDGQFRRQRWLDKNKKAA